MSRVVVNLVIPRSGGLNWLLFPVGGDGLQAEPQSHDYCASVHERFLCHSHIVFSAAMAGDKWDFWTSAPDRRSLPPAVHFSGIAVLLPQRS